MANKKTNKLRRVDWAAEANAHSDIHKIIACEESLEQGLHFLVQAINEQTKKGKKPVVIHSLRVALKLMSHDFGLEVILAGLLHDLLEKSVFTPAQVMRRFGPKVAAMVQATTNDLAIRDPIARDAVSVMRCAAYGEGALLVRAADLLDNCERGLMIGGLARLQRLSLKLKLLIQVCRDEDVDHAIIEELTRCQRRVNRRLSGLAIVQSRR